MAFRTSGEVHWRIRAIVTLGMLTAHIAVTVDPTMSELLRERDCGSSSAILRRNPAPAATFPGPSLRSA